MFVTPEADHATARRDQAKSQVTIDPLESIDSVSPGNESSITCAVTSPDDGSACNTSAPKTYSCNPWRPESARTELVEDCVYECPYCGDKRIEMEVNPDSKGVITRDFASRLALVEFMEGFRTVKIDRVVCMGCGEDVPVGLLPDRLFIGNRQSPVMELQIMNSSSAGGDMAFHDSRDANGTSTLEDKDNGEDGVFGCPRCSNRNAVVRLEVYLDYSNDYKPLTGPSAKLSESRLRKATCAQCGYAYLEGMLPSQIVIRGCFKWKIDVCLGVFVAELQNKSWKEQIGYAVRNAYVHVISQRHEAARRLIRRIIRILQIRAHSLSEGPNTTKNTDLKHWNANEMYDTVERLEQKFLANPLPVFDQRQCIESSGCPYLWADIQHSSSEPPCFRWAGGSCRKKQEAEQNRNVR